MMRLHTRQAHLTRRLLTAVLVCSAALTGCSQEAATTTEATTTTAPPNPAGVSTTAANAATEADFDPFVLTLNVDITDNGYEPSSLFIPAGRSVQLVIRNRTRTEHHYRVVGLEVTDLLWLAEPETDVEEGVSEEDHLLHHIAAFVEWRSTSPAGIKPTLDQVHGYAAGGVNDVVRFTATSIGTFSVGDPLHPEFTGTITVFE